MEMMDGLNEVTLVVKRKKEFRVSRNELSEASPFFSALFNSDMRENKEGIIRLEHITNTVMNDVLQFTRSGRVEITPTNVQDLIVAADYLLLPNLKTIAGRFLKDDITNSNCISIYYFAEKYQCEEHVICKAREFILLNFEIVSKSEEFLNLEFQQLEEWISSDEIAISSEKEVIKIILKWAKHRKNERKGKLEELFRHVRFAFVSRDYLTDVVTNHLVTENSSCLKLVWDAMRGAHSITEDDVPPPSRKWQHNHLVVLAGNDTLCYDPDEKKWYQMGNARRYHQQYNLLSFEGKLYVFPRYKDFCQSERYDSLCDSWNSLDLVRRYDKCQARFTAVLGTEIYVIDYFGTLNQGCHSVMKYKVESNSWQEVSRLPHHGSKGNGTRACVVAMDNYLYVIGGAWYTSGRVNAPLKATAKSVRFNTIEKKWESIASMQRARHSACGVAACGKIFIAGGVSPPNYFRLYSEQKIHPYDITKTCEMYNVFTNEWQFIASLQKPRWGGSMVYLKGSLYVVGGNHFEGQIPTDNLVVESYDFESNSWKLKTKIPVLSRDAPSKRYKSIKASTLTVCDQVLQRPITQSTRFQLLKKLLTPSTA